MLRTHKLGEADRIITLLTRQHGRVRAVAKGVRKTTSRWGSRLEPFTHVDLQLAVGRSLDIVTQAETIEPFAVGARQRLRAVHRRHRDARDRRPAGHRGGAAGGPAVPAARRRPARDDGGDPDTRRGANQVLDSYLLRSLAVAGYAPSFSHCARCGDEGPHKSFSPSAGGALCSDCRVPGLGLTVGRHPRRARRAAHRRLGRWSRPPTRGHCARRPVWCRRTCTGTSSAGCGRWSTSSARRP